jgi:hypothetical protein
MTPIEHAFVVTRLALDDRMVTYTARGAVAARRLEKLAKQHGWGFQFIDNANGCYGMFARTDGVAVRKLTKEEAEVVQEEARTRREQNAAAERHLRSIALTHSVWGRLGFQPEKGGLVNGVVLDRHYVCRTSKNRRALARTIQLQEEWLRWNGGTVVLLARSAVPDTLPILADALEDAGCDVQAFLAHLRRVPHDGPCFFVEFVFQNVP